MKEAISWGKVVLGLLLAGVNPKNILLTAGAATTLSQLGLDPSGAAISLIVLVLIGSLTIAAPVLHHLAGGNRARTTLDGLKAWLMLHNDAVMTVLFVVFGTKVIADAIPPLTS